jgi:hypothetical protein
LRGQDAWFFLYPLKIMKFWCQKNNRIRFWRINSIINISETLTISIRDFNRFLLSVEIKVVLGIPWMVESRTMKFKLHKIDSAKILVLLNWLLCDKALSSLKNLKIQRQKPKVRQVEFNLLHLNIQIINKSQNLIIDTMEAVLIIYRLIFPCKKLQP